MKPTCFCLGIVVVFFLHPMFAQQEPLQNSTSFTNFVPLWTSNTTLGISEFFQVNGAYGLGTTRPSAKLDVVTHKQIGIMSTVDAPQSAAIFARACFKNTSGA
jgi:hypothetical protein